MALASAISSSSSSKLHLVEEVYNATAQELKMAGINWDYAPVADVNSDGRNPVIGVRSFGDDPTHVSSCVLAAIRGLQSQSGGVAACVKHFPGHGDTHTDSHHALPLIVKSREQIEKVELVPFRAAIEEGVGSVMVGHMSFPTLVGNDTPCSLSCLVTTSLLRTELGFGGVVVTDCLEMRAVLDGYRDGAEKGAVLALKAGADMVLLCHSYDRQVGALDAICRSVEDGELDWEEVVKGGKRIGEMKSVYCGSWEEVLRGSSDQVEVEKMLDQHQRLSERAYASSIAWIGGKEYFRPISQGGGEKAMVYVPRLSVTHFNPAMDQIQIQVAGIDSDGKAVNDGKGGKGRKTASTFLEFARSLTLGGESDHVVYADDLGLENSIELEGVTYVIFILADAQTEEGRWQVGVLRKVLDAIEIERSNSNLKTQVVLVSTGGPYDLIGEDEEDLKLELEARGLRVAHLVSYENTLPAMRAVAAVLRGEKEAVGVVPVSLL